MPQPKKAVKIKSGVMDEVSKLGQVVKSAVKSVGHNPELKSAALGALKDLETAAGRLGQALKSTAAGPASQKVQKQAKKVLQTGWSQASKATVNYRATIAGGLKKLSGELNALAGKLSKQ
jgi:hypothetical protein